MPNLMNSGAQKVSGTIKVYGDVVDESGVVLATFGATGTNYSQWFAALPADEQLEIVLQLIPQRMVPWLLKQAGLAQ